MAFPASAIPAQNAFCVHCFGPENAGAFSVAADIATALLTPSKVPVHRNLPKEDTRKSTLTLIDGNTLVVEEKSSRSILVAMSSESNPSGQNSDWIQTPDLWIVKTGEQKDPEALAEEWMKFGAGAVLIFHTSGKTAWLSRNSAFGHSLGASAPLSHRELKMGNESIAFGYFVGGALHALMEELLEDNLFSKTMVGVDRECLEMCPLHLHDTAESGLATTDLVFENNLEETLHKKGDALGKLRQRLHEWRGPESQPWGIGSR